MVAAVVPPLVSSSAISSIFFLASSNPNFSVNPFIPKLSIALTIPSRALPPKPIASFTFPCFSAKSWAFISKSLYAAFDSLFVFSTIASVSDIAALI